MPLGLPIPLNPLRPAIETIRQYDLTKLRHDLLAGLTVSVVEVPQAMAYALIAGVPPQFGLYASIIQGFLGALLSSSNHLTTGPTNTQSLLVASTVARLAGATGAQYLEMVFALTLLKGLIQLAFAAANLGDLMRYVSRSVIVGVAAGAGVLIVVGQFDNFLGLRIEGPPTRLPGIIGDLVQLVPHFGQANGRAVTIGLMTVAIALIARRVSRLLPGALIAVVVSAALVALLGWTDAHLPLVGTLPRSLPAFALPLIPLDHLEALLGGALALALLGMMESVAIAKTIAAHTGERIEPNREFFAQGLTNLLSGFFQCIPGSGSFTRSALDHDAGAKTRFAAVYNSIFVAAIFLLFAQWAAYVPLASLAGILFVIAVGLVDWEYLRRLARTSRAEEVVCATTFMATVLAPLQYAIFIGIFLNLALYLRTASRLHVAEMVYTPGGKFLERPLHDRSGDQRVIFLQVEGELFFGVADELNDQLTRLARSGVRVVILRLKRTHSIDSTVLHVIEQFARGMNERKGHVILCGVRPQLMTLLRDFGLVDVIGRDNVFPAGEGVFSSAKQAIARARRIVGASIDAEGLDVEEESEEITYEI